MNNRTRLKIVCSPRQALSRLSRENIPVYNCKKQGAWFAFSVPDNFVQKVFAIFARPCYNITIERKSALTRLKNFAVRRAFLIAGCAAFIAASCLSNAFVLKITVTGSGAYLADYVKGVAYSLGVRENSIYRGGEEPDLISRVLALPSVTFCSVQKRGSILYIDVETEEESGSPAGYVPLKSDGDGTVESIVAICGTVQVSAGDSVSAGDTLIAAYTEVSGQNVPCIAVGYAVILRSAAVSYTAAEESEQSLESAYAAALIYTGGEEIVSRDYTVKTTAEGVIYNVDFTYRHTVSINFD